VEASSQRFFSKFSPEIFRRPSPTRVPARKRYSDITAKAEHVTRPPVGSDELMFARLVRYVGGTATIRIGILAIPVDAIEGAVFECDIGRAAERDRNDECGGFDSVVLENEVVALKKVPVSLRRIHECGSQRLAFWAFDNLAFALCLGQQVIVRVLYDVHCAISPVAVGLRRPPSS